MGRRDIESVDQWVKNGYANSDLDSLFLVSSLYHSFHSICSESIHSLLRSFALFDLNTLML